MQVQEAIMPGKNELRSLTKSALIDRVEALESELARLRAHAGSTANSPPAMHSPGDHTARSLIDALERVDDGVVVYDADDRLVFVNQAYLRHLPEDVKALYIPGIAFQDLVRAHTDRGLIDQAIGREEEFIRMRLDRHRNAMGLSAHRFSNGTWYEILEYSLLDGGILTVRRDVSEWIAVTTALRENEERFRDFAEASQDWLWEMDENLRFSYFSDRFYWASGVRPEQLLGRSRRETLWDNPDEEPWKSHIADLEAHRSFRDFIHSRMRPDGEINYLAISGKPVYDKDGNFQGYRGTGRNITKQWRAERDLARAKETAERANRAKTDFLANMSHEFRTPLNSIIGYSELIGMGTFGPLGSDKYAEYVDNIRHSGRHLLELINDVLDISLIEAGEVHFHEEIFDIREAVQACVTLMEEEAKQADIVLKSKLDAMPPFFGDERRLRQIVINLLSNAIKFTPDGGTVQVDLEKGAEGGLLVRVSDTGIGIAEQDKEKVLSPFGQAEGAFARRFKGVGLGLPLVKNLTEMHDGELILNSTPGKGTSVTVHFPPTRLRALERG
jgi:two-component system cell cycle sensor histidine kinase PleC